MGPWANDLFSQYLHPRLVNEGRYHACLVHQGLPLRSSSSPLPTHPVSASVDTVFAASTSCPSCCNGTLARPVLMGAPPPLLQIIPRLPCLQDPTHLQQGERAPSQPVSSPASLPREQALSSPTLSLSLRQPSLLGLWVEPRRPVPASCPLFLRSAPHPAGPRSHSPGALGTPQATKPKDSAAPPGFPARPSSLLQSYGFPATSLPARRLRPPSWIPHLGFRLAS